MKLLQIVEGGEAGGGYLETYTVPALRGQGERAIRAIAPGEVLGEQRTLVSLFARQPERGLGPLEHAIELNPSLTWAHWGRGTALWVLDVEQVEEGIAALERAIRLSPQDPFLHFMLSFRAIGQLAAGRLDEAQASLERSRHLAPGEPHACPLLAICLVLRGEIEPARAQIARMREIHPTCSPLLHARRFSASGHLEGYTELLAEAGWQEPDPVGSGSAG